MRYAFVTTNVLDLWSHSKFNSGRVNQLLFATPVRVNREAQGYCEVEEPGGYRGWADSGHLAGLTRTDYRRLLDSRSFVVAARSAKLYGDRSGHSVPPHELYYGTVLPLAGIRDGLARVRLPNGFVGYVNAGTLDRLTIYRKRSVSSRKLVSEARRFLGVPYLWGGVTALGFDCSGMVQTICRRFGIVIQRDTGQQIHAGRPIDRKEVRTGDLLFFDRHVGFATGRNRLIHCSVGGGGVREESLDPGDADYRPDLHRSFKEARRIVAQY
jgi:hypothetical protein